MGTRGKGLRSDGVWRGVAADNAVAAVEASYQNDVTDEFVVPAVCPGGAVIGKNDSVIFFNFRPDRAREITRTFVDPDFQGLSRRNGYFPVKYVCMTQYDATMPNVEVAFKPQTLENTFGEYISKMGLSQLRIAETEKYAHVTFFFNGGVEKQYPKEDRKLINSPKVATYDLKPEMSAYEVTDALLERIASDQYDVIILNYANCDMVGHTGVFEAAKAAAEAVDTCIGRVVDAILAKGGAAIITADHGNADKMYDTDGSPFYGALHQSGAVLCSRLSLQAPGRRASRRYCADDAEDSWLATAVRNDGKKALRNKASGFAYKAEGIAPKQNF